MVRPQWKPDLAEVRRLAQLGLSNAEIASALGCAQSTLYMQKSGNSEFSEALAWGRAQGLAQVANVLFDAATKNGDIRACLEYLKRHGELWRENTTKIDVSANLAVQHNAEVSKLPDEVAERMTVQYLRMRGYKVDQTNATLVAPNRLTKTESISSRTCH
jgi:hypothetical protein